MNPFSLPDRICVSLRPQDMRAGIQRLATIITLEFGEEPMDGSLYVFISRDARKAKMLTFDINGWCLLNELFHIDNQFNDMTPDARKAARLKLLKPKMDYFKSWCELQYVKAVPGMALSGALSYTLNQWPKLENALLDGRIPLENNLSERAIKSFVIGRKNFLFCDTQSGAEASATYYSLVQTARENKIKPFKYLSWLLEEMPNTEHLEDKEVLERFLPWSEYVPESCHMSTEEAMDSYPMDD